MHRQLFILFLLCISFAGVSQKQLQKEFDAKNFNSVVINGEEASLIRVLSENRSTIKINTLIEGEYYESVVLEVFEQNKTLLLKPAFAPFFEKHNDKLAAHKVLSVTLEVVVPENLFISISSKNAFIDGVGDYRFFYAETRSGTITLDHFKGNADLKTNTGNIFVKASKTDVSAYAKSRNGLVTNKLPDGNRFIIHAQSEAGDIEFLETK